MTTQEFVKKEAATKYPLTTGQPAEADSWNEAFNEVFSDGLTKGLEIAADVLDFAVNKYFSVERIDGKTYFAKLTETQKIQYLTTSELLTIFLTEKYGK